MVFDIRFIHYIYTIFIAQFIKRWMIWIMTSTYCIHVQPFYSLQIIHYYFLSLNMSQTVVVFMSIHTFNIDRYSIYMQLGILYFNFTETNLVCSNSQRSTGFIGQRHCAIIQIWILCTPLLYILNRTTE